MQVDTLQTEKLNVSEDVFDMDVFSYSRLKKFEDCPFQFFKKYILGKEEPKTFPLALGSAAHDAIEGALSGKDKSLALGEAIMEQDYFDDYKVDTLDTINTLNEFIANAPVDYLLEKDDLEIEKYFKIPLSDEDNAPYIRGYIDVIVDKQEIWDWKTNRFSYDVTEEHQQGLYAWAIAKKYEMEDIDARLFFLRNKWYSKHTYTQEDQEEARKWAYNLALDIQRRLQELKKEPTMLKAAELFQANTNKYCEYCPFVAECFRVFDPLPLP